MVATSCAIAAPRAPAVTKSDRVDEPPVLLIAAPHCIFEGPPKQQLPAHAELADAFTAVRPDVQRCMALHGIAGHLYVDVRIDGGSGRIAAASSRVAPPNEALDACVNEALVAWCIHPFVAELALPYLELRLPFGASREQGRP
jgi:hypothetical protein